MEETIFDKILRQELPADVVYEDEWVLAFRDINPQAPHHILVIPKEKITSIAAVENQEADKLGNYFKSIAKVAKKIGLEDGYRVVFNHGRHGQQTVDYLHAHIIGGRQLNWPPG